MNAILRDRSFRVSIILTLIFCGTGIACLFLGLSGYSWILFALLPVLLGISIGALPKPYLAWYGAAITTFLFLLLLLAGQLSGFICIAMALPILLPLIYLGTVITHLVNRYHKIKREQTLPVLLLPLLVFIIAAPIERHLKTERTESVAVSTSRVFPYTPEQVYDAIKSVDTLDAKKPLLMHFDLPVPTKCILEKEEVGGLRTCYFHKGNLSTGDFGGGTITERITQIERGKVLKMDVIAYNLIGRKWLGFKEAAYYFEKTADGTCRMTRVTTYTSELTPRIYWEPLEKLGIEQEHEYVFANLEKDLARKYRK